MEKKINAIVVKSFDSGDRDKLITLFSPEGLFQAKLKGVNSAKSKLKFFKQPFCFAEFVLAGDKIPVVTSANLIESFYDLCLSYDRYSEASTILQIARPLMKQDQPNPYLFVQLLQAFKTLAYSDVQQFVTQTKFLINLFYNQGYGFDCDVCSHCGLKLSLDRYFDLSTGEILCTCCKNQYCKKISYGINKVYKIINQTEYDNLKNIKFGKQSLLDALHLLLQNYTNVIL